MRTNYFDIYQILPAVFWLIVIYLIAFAKKQNIKGEHAKYYLQAVTVKLFFGLAFTLYFLILVGHGGGDTGAYFDGAIKMNNLFWKSPTMYFEQLFSTPSTQLMYELFDAETGYPPGWIYREPPSFVVSKIASLFTFFTFNSFFATVFLFAFIVANASWRLFEFVVQLNVTSVKWSAIGVLLLPSVSFWCSGITKDTIVLVSIYWIVAEVFKVLILKQKFTFIGTSLIVLGLFLIYHTRTVIFVSILLPLALSLLNLFLKKVSIPKNIQRGMKLFVLLVGLLIMGEGLSSELDNELIKEAEATQKDFQSNKTYTGKRYDLGAIEFSPVGLVRVAPLAIITGVIRPFPWEALSPSLILNGLEGMFFLYMIYQFFAKNRKEKIEYIKNNEFLMYSFTFVLLLGFIAGLTSGLFGVLVRLRAPILAFFLILLSVQALPKQKKSEIEEDYLS